MPEMDGVEAVSKIRAWERGNEARMPIVAMTANALRGMKEFYLEHGFDDYIAKPIDPRSLDEVIIKYKERLTKNNVNIAAETEAQRLDMLNHYRVSFESGRSIDADYLKRFTTLIESFGYSEQAATLIEAGRRGDVQKIREILPSFCAAWREMARVQHKEGAIPREIVSRLKNAVFSGTSAEAESIMKELGAVKLETRDRELYFLLNDLLLAGDTEKAAGAISLWEKLV